MVASFSSSVLGQATGNVLGEAEKSQGFKPLFDGTLQSFKDNFVDYQRNNPNTSSISNVWQVDAATSAIITRTNTGAIRSKTQYTDFDWRLDYRNNGNQGLFYRFNLAEEHAFESGIEVAIDNMTDACKSCPGAAYDIYPPVGNAYKPFATGEWNSIRVVVIKDSVEHWLNGKKVVGFKYHSADFWKQYNESKWNSDSKVTFKVPRDRNAGYIDTGYIGFQADHGGNWNIRNMRISTTNPYFGPMKSAPPVGIGAAAETASKLSYSVAKEASGGLSLSFRDQSVLGAILVSLDGKAVLAGRLAEGGSKVSFSAASKPGVYILNVRTASGNITRKLNIL